MSYYGNRGRGAFGSRHPPDPRYYYQRGGLFHGHGGSPQQYLRHQQQQQLPQRQHHQQWQPQQPPLMEIERDNRIHVAPTGLNVAASRPVGQQQQKTNSRVSEEAAVVSLLTASSTSPSRVLNLANSGAKTRKEMRIWKDIVSSGSGTAPSRSNGSRSKRPDPRGEDETVETQQPAAPSTSATSSSSASTSGPALPVVVDTKAAEVKPIPQPSLAVQRMQLALELSLQEEQVDLELENQKTELIGLKQRLLEMQKLVDAKENDIKKLTEKKTELTTKRLAILKESVSAPVEELSPSPSPSPPPALPPQLPPPKAVKPSVDASSGAATEADPDTVEAIRRIIQSECSKELTFADMDRLLAEEMRRKRPDLKVDDDDNDIEMIDETVTQPLAKRPRTLSASDRQSDSGNSSSAFASVARSLQAAASATSTTVASSVRHPAIKSERTDLSTQSTATIDKKVKQNENKLTAKQKTDHGKSSASTSKNRQRTSSSSSSSSSSDSDSEAAVKARTAPRQPSLSLAQQRERNRLEESAPTSSMALPGHFSAHESEQILCATITNGFLFTGSVDGTAKRFSMQTHECLNTYRRGGGSSTSAGNANCRINCVVVTNRGCVVDVFRVYSGGSDSVLSVHNSRTGDLLKRCSLDSHLWTAFYRWDSIFLGLGSGRVCKYDLNSSTLMQGWIGCEGPVSSLAVTVAEGRRVVLVGCQAEKLVIVRDESSGILLFNIKQPSPPVAVRAPCFGSHVFCLTNWSLQTYHSAKWDSPIGQFRSDVTGSPSVDLRLMSLHASLRGTWLFIGCSDGSVRCHRLEFGSSADNFRHLVVWASPGRNSVTAVEFFESARCLIACDSSGCVSIVQLPRLNSRVQACNWAGCNLAFLDIDQLMDHLRRAHGATEANTANNKCQWLKCSKTLKTSDPAATEKHLRWHCNSSSIDLAKL